MREADTYQTIMNAAPEMLTGDNFHGKPVDIWACGVTLYMFVYGRPPFLAQTMTELYGRIQVRVVPKSVNRCANALISWTLIE